MDPKARLELRNLLCSLHDQGTTILISSHILSELEGFCTSFGIMEKGHIVQSGKIEELSITGGLSRSIRIAWVGDSLSMTRERLQNDPRISEVRLAERSGSFRFAGSEEDLSSVLTGLINAGVSVTSFTELKQTVEEIYMKLSSHEVM